MDFLTLITIIGLIIGIISGILGIISYFLWYRGFLKFLGYSIWVRLFNRKPMVFDVILTIKYDTIPSQQFNYIIFNEFKTASDPSTVKITKQNIRPENITFLITDKHDLYWFPISIFLDEESVLTSTNIEEENTNNIISYNITIQLSHKLTLTWKQLDLIEDLSKYIKDIKIILKNNLYKHIDPRNEFYVCNINRGFSLTDMPKEEPKEKLKFGAKKININKNILSITGSNIQKLKKIIKKYYFGKVSYYIWS